MRTRRRLNARAYLAGGAATSALIAAAVLVFSSLAAYVAFEGLPIAADNPAPAEQLVESGSRAPEAAATAAATGAVTGAVAAVAAASTALPPLPGEVRAGANGGGSVGTGTAPATPGSPSAPGTAPTGSGQSSQPGVAPAGGSPGAAQGPVGNAVDGAGQATGLPLGEATHGVTAPVDEAINDVLGGSGNAGGQGGLGGPVGGLVDGATGGLLP